MVTESEIEPLEVLVGYRLAAQEYAFERWGFPLRNVERRNQAVWVFHLADVDRLRGRYGPMKIVWLHGTSEVSAETKTALAEWQHLADAMAAKPATVPETGPDQ